MDTGGGRNAQGVTKGMPLPKIKSLPAHVLLSQSQGCPDEFRSCALLLSLSKSGLPDEITRPCHSHAPFLSVKVRVAKM